MAISEKHWAAFVKVGGPSTVTFGDKTFETRPLVGGGSQAKPTYDLLVDGRRTQLEGDRDMPVRLAWSGDTLAAMTSDRRIGRLESDGLFVADASLAPALAEPVD